MRLIDADELDRIADAVAAQLEALLGPTRSGWREAQDLVRSWAEESNEVTTDE